VKETLNQIAVIGKPQEAASIVLHLANTGATISFFDLTNQLPQALSLDEKLDKNPQLLFSRNFMERIEQYGYKDLFRMISAFDWIVFALNDHTSVKIKELLMEMEGLLHESTLISVASENQSIRLPVYIIPSSIKPVFTGIRLFEPFRKCGLVEVVSLPETSTETIERIRDFCEDKIGKSSILCQKAGFADRLVCFIRIWALRTGLNLCLDLEQINWLTGSIMGWPGKGAIADIDIEGAENFYKKSKNLFHESLIPEEKDSYIFLNLLVMPPSGYFTDTNLVFDPLKGKYRKLKKKKAKGLIQYKNIEIEKRLPLLMDGSSSFHQFYQELWRGIFKYVSQLVENRECSVHDADLVFKEILGWELGPFELWNSLDARTMVRKMEMQGYQPEPWVYKMLENGENSFIQFKEGQQLYYDLSGDYQPTYGSDKMILPRSYKNKIIWENDTVIVYDLGDYVSYLEIHTYRNIIDEDVANGILYAIKVAEREKRGLIISGEGKDFTLGANLGLVFFAAIEKNYKMISHFVREFQSLTSRVRYSDVPIVVLPKGLTLGGGCEIALHSDDILCYAETYMGLPEARAGLVPAGGGTKEMALKLLKEGASPDKYVEIMFNLFEGKVSSSAFEALEMGYLVNERQIIRNKKRQLAAAKKMVVDIMEKGYKKPLEFVHPAVGKTFFQHMEKAIQHKEGVISPFESRLAGKIANILTGGNSSNGQTMTEQHYLDLELEAFLSQCGERETLKRLKDILSRKKKR
jgi:3-hydroxyacyl-CoA dehydrogenase